jgi:hypothetical protein
MHSEKPTEVSQTVQSHAKEESRLIPKQPGRPPVYKHKAGGISLTKSIEIVRKNATSHQPLLWLLFLPGVFRLRKVSRIIYLGMGAWLLVLGGLLPPLKPQLELDRMLILLGIISCVPAARALDDLISRYRYNSLSSRALTCLSLGFVFAGLMSVAAVLRERTLVPFSLASRDLGGLPQAIIDNHNQGRVLFSGFVLHDLLSGHVSPLAHFTGVPLMASSHVHNLWKYKQIFPREFLKEGDSGILHYLDLYNVSIVLAHEKKWREKFGKWPEKFQKIWSNNHFVMFKRNSFPQTYFLEGKGEVLSQTSSEIHLRVDSPSSVLRFHYLPFLSLKGENSQSCTLSSKKIAEDISFIKLDNCIPGSHLTVSSLSALNRFFLHNLPDGGTH